MKEKIFDLMEKSLSAYSDDHILRYFNDVKENGLTEHGFPRLTANIGILIARGRRRDLLPVFLEMMEFCCRTIPQVHAANDFSVREIVGCLLEIEQSGGVSAEVTERWRGYLASIEPLSCYDKFATSPTDTVRNWALFTAVSEYFRQQAGLCDSAEFVELQLCQQLQWLDENGMYMDNTKHTQRQPIMYDLVPRGLFSLLLDRGYRGEHYKTIDDSLKKAGILTLDMQSPNGEMAFGGRSNQFLFNEAWVSAVFEYEAKRYAREGNCVLAARFKAASARALAVVGKWLDKEPIRHIKNRFPTDTRYGCEKYAYFNKYMITVASILYVTYLICDDSISFDPCEDIEPCVAETTEYFHKLFMKAGGYGIEFDLRADPHYDASGLGRIQRIGAPSAICLSCPCPSEPSYVVDIAEPFAFSLCSAVKEKDEWLLGADLQSTYEALSCGTTENMAKSELLCHFANGRQVKETYSVEENGVSIMLHGDGEIGFALPAFAFDGETHTEICADEHSLTVAYDSWLCKYTTDGEIISLNKTAANRNGHYYAFLATAEKELSVKIELLEFQKCEKC